VEVLTEVNCVPYVVKLRYATLGRVPGSPRLGRIQRPPAVCTFVRGLSFCNPLEYPLIVAAYFTHMLFFFRSYVAFFVYIIGMKWDLVFQSCIVSTGRSPVINHPCDCLTSGLTSSSHELCNTAWFSHEVGMLYHKV